MIVRIEVRVRVQNQRHSLPKFNINVFGRGEGQVQRTSDDCTY